MCKKYILMIAMVIASIMLSACQKENDILGTQPFVNAETDESKENDSYGSYPPHSPIYFSGYEEYVAFF